MHFLLHLLASSIARRVEAGSPKGALIGLLAGILAGLAIWCALSQNHDMPTAYIIALAIPPALLGTFMGSYLPIGVRISEQIDASTVIRLNNFNRSVPPMLLLTGFSAGNIALWHEWLTHRQGPPVGVPIFFSALLGILAAACILPTCRAVLWVELGSRVSIRKLFGRRNFEAQQISSWTIGSADRLVTLALLFDNDLQILVPIAPAKIEAVTKRMYELAPEALNAVQRVAGEPTPHVASASDEGNNLPL